ncbi:MAG: hypothetical protein OEN00_16200, partial [Gemmatimonadota bacterium]|nr:hypothetical protein [Gemmatimonadota bacterium]
MRFAYIDSNGNEVPIPSVDALALRIELGAIDEHTQLYDAQADQWGPAHTHEIFHSLSRDSTEEDGFVAPPPAAPSAGAVPDTPTPPSKTTEKPTPDTASTADLRSDAPRASGEEVEEEEADGSFGLTLASQRESEEAPVDRSVHRGSDPLDRASSVGADEPLDFAPSEGGTMDLSAARDTPTDLAPSGAAADFAEPVESGMFDFGEGSLEVEEAFEPPTDAPSMDLSAGGAPDFSGAMGLETSMEFDSGGFDSGDGSPLELEAPMSDFSPQDPPSWMEESEASGADDVLDFSTAGEAAQVDGEVDVPLRKRTTPRNKPSPPKLRKQRNLALPLVIVVLLLAVGVGGYAAWPLVSDRLSRVGGGPDQAVVIPPLADDLMPVMRSASEAAIGAVFEQARSGWMSGQMQAPPTDWLAGIYLANASDYPEVTDFWEGMADLLGLVRAMDLASFDAAMRAELAARGTSAVQSQAIVARADSGFVAAAPDRAEAFDRFQSVIDAALQLHRFLVANQE